MTAATVGAHDYETKHTVMAPVIHAEPRESHGRRYEPRSIAITWRCDTEHGWRAGWVSLYGPQIRKDGTFGTREIDETLWVDPGNQEWPAFVTDFYESTKPQDLVAA